MLARLDSAPTSKPMNCWGTTVKDVWGPSQAMHSVYARWLSSGHSSIRSLLFGPSLEAATLARVAGANRRSTTAANNALITAATDLSAWTATAPEIRAELQRREVAMTQEELRNAEHLLEFPGTRLQAWR